MYGWLSMRRRRSSFTALRWFSRFACDDVQRAHAVGLEPQAEVEAVRRQRLEVVRAVVARCVPFMRAARALDELEVLALGDVGRALEHHVLEQVREAGAAGALVPRADVVPDVDRRDLRAVVLGEHDRQPVGQLVALGGDAGRLAGERAWTPARSPAREAGGCPTPRPRAAAARARRPAGRCGTGVCDDDATREPREGGRGERGDDAQPYKVGTAGHRRNERA